MRLERPYYPCAAGGPGFCPREAVWGVTAAALSPAADEGACGAGVHSSFAEAREKGLPQLAGRRRADSTGERTTEAAGRRLAAAQRAGQSCGPPPEWAGPKDPAGKTVADGAGDATGVPQHGQDGAKADRRRAKVAVLYQPVPDDPACWAPPAAEREPPGPARYGAGLERGAELGATVRQQGVAGGMERAARWMVLSAGGSGLEACRRTPCPRVAAVSLDC